MPVNGSRRMEAIRSLCILAAEQGQEPDKPVKIFLCYTYYIFTVDNTCSVRAWEYAFLIVVKTRY